MGCSWVEFLFSKAGGRGEWIFVGGMSVGRNFVGCGRGSVEFRRLGEEMSGISRVVATCRGESA